jgi:pimeloyl-ACP methyl ester carboxylesterase
MIIEVDIKFISHLINDKDGAVVYLRGTIIMKIKKNQWKHLTFIFTAIAVLSMVGLQIIDMSISQSEEIRFSSDENDCLRGHYYPGSNDNGGVILLEGFGSDQVTMRSLVNEFARMGVSVFTFDFSGHGRSSGGLDFDNTQTDRLAKQVIAAKIKFKQISNLSDHQIIYLGHSLGARVALQAATMDDKPPLGIILIGTQVNLLSNLQSEFFTGVQDSTLEWVKLLDPSTPATQVLMVSGTWDDILPVNGALTLFSTLSGTEQISTNFDGSIGFGTSREMIIFDRLVHNYEIFSPRILEYSKKWSGNLWGIEYYSQNHPISEYRIWLWIISIFSLLCSLITGNIWLTMPDDQLEYNGFNIKIKSFRKFIAWKLIFWIFSIPIILSIIGFVFLFPLNKPVFNLYFVGFIGGYGIVLWFVYKFGRMPGTCGKLPFYTHNTKQDSQRIFPAIVFGFLVSLYLTLFARTGLFFIFPPNQRLFWLFAFSPAAALGFWIGNHELQIVKKTYGNNFGLKIITSVTNLVPFFLFIIMMIGLGSLSGFIGGLQGILVLLIVMISGSIMEKLSKNSWFSACFQAFLLFWIVLPQGVLFR